MSYYTASSLSSTRGHGINNDIDWPSSSLGSLNRRTGTGGGIAAASAIGVSHLPCVAT
jgi:hypothetical protein